MIDYAPKFNGINSGEKLNKVEESIKGGEHTKCSIISSSGISTHNKTSRKPSNPEGAPNFTNTKGGEIKEIRNILVAI